MSNPIPTATQSAIKDELHQFFERFASKAFDRCWDAQCKVGFYDKLLADLRQGRVLSEELPEAEDLPPSVLRSVVQKLRKKTSAAVEAAWELQPAINKDFRTTIRTALPEGETLSQYDIEYSTIGAKEAAKIRIKTWRRKIEVELIGTANALEALHSRIVMEGLRPETSR